MGRQQLRTDCCLVYPFGYHRSFLLRRLRRRLWRRRLLLITPGGRREFKAYALNSFFDVAGVRAIINPEQPRNGWLFGTDVVYRQIQDVAYSAGKHVVRVSNE